MGKILITGRTLSLVTHEIQFAYDGPDLSQHFPGGLRHESAGNSVSNEARLGGLVCPQVVALTNLETRHNGI